MYDLLIFYITDHRKKGKDVADATWYTANEWYGVSVTKSKHRTKKCFKKRFV